MRKAILVIMLMLGLSLTAGGCGSQLIQEQKEPLSVYGETARFSLRSVDFIDENTGWLVRDAADSKQLSSQILQTENGGTSWQAVANLQDARVERLKFVNQTTGWAIAQATTSTAANEQSYSTRILHTNDGGQNWDVQWEDKLNPSANVNFTLGNLWFPNASQGYALLNGKLLATQDGGKQWTPILDVADFTPQHMSFVNRDMGWVLGTTKAKLVVLYTGDGGKHWQQQFAQDYPSGDIRIGSIDINFVNETTGWFLTTDLATMQGNLYYTADAGREWQKINQIGSARPSPTQLRFLTPTLGWIPLAVCAGPISGGLLSTKDGGKTFTKVGSDQQLSSARVVDFISDQQGWAIGETPNQGDYLIRTSDGGQSWTQTYPKLKPTKDISFVDNQNGYGLGQLFDSGALIRTSDGGTTWQKIYSFSGKYWPSKLSFINNNQGWVTATVVNEDKTVILKTTDGGKTWVALKSEIPQSAVSFASYFRFFDPANGIMAAPIANATNFYRTQDGGHTWDLSLKENSRGIYQFSFMSPNQGWQVFSGGTGRNSIDFSRMKGWGNWRDLSQISANALAYGIDFISPEQGFMVLEDSPFGSGRRVKLLVTTNGGRTWSSHSFPSGFRLDMLSDHIPIQFTDDKHGWILSTLGLLRTNDGGNSWTLD